MTTNTELAKVNSFKSDLAAQYMVAIKNYLGDEQKAMSFLSGASFLVQKVPKLLECKRETLFNAIIQVAELKLNLGPSGEAYIIPYGTEAQLQIGYKGIVTLLYRAGIQSIKAEIVYKNDDFKNINGKIQHNIDIFKSTKDRGEPVGCYVIAKVNGEEISKAMNVDDIMKFKVFSKSAKFDSSPWNASKDPELNMWKKTVLKQLSKYLPQNETLSRAIEIDNQDSMIGDEEMNVLDSNAALDKTLEGFGEGEEGDKKDIS